MAIVKALSTLKFRGRKGTSCLAEMLLAREGSQHCIRVQSLARQNKLKERKSRNEFLGSTKGGEYLDQMGDQQLFKAHSVV